MQQPDHDIRIARATQATPRRLISLAIVGLLHLVFIYALVTGLAQSLVKKGLDEIKVATVQDKPVVKPPPPPPPPLEQPPPPFVPPPDIVIQSAAPVATITTQDRQPVIPPPAPKVAAPVTTVLTPKGRTHSLPPYPEMSVRLSEQGTTKLRVTINPEGDCTDAVVESSSGSQRLDQASIDYVKSHWKWNPPTTDGKPSSAQTEVAITWNLKNAH